MNVETLLRQYAQGDRDFSNIELVAADLKGANLSGAFLVLANLEGADLTGAMAIAVNSSGARLQEANFAHSNLTEAILAGTWL